MMPDTLVFNSLSDVVDMSVLSSLQGAPADGETDLIVELIDLYLEDTPRRLAAISVSLVRGDSAFLRRAAHNLRGGSATLGAVGISQICEELEQIALNSSPNAAASLLSELHEKFAIVRQAFLLERLKRTRQGRGLIHFPVADAPLADIRLMGDYAG
jgi:HPt (histidine-containing phosphotransfer) domain-containing protein